MLNFKRKNKFSNLEEYFQEFRKYIIGNDVVFESSYGNQKLLYADWVASGRLYKPIEDTIQHIIGPMVANTHSFSSETGKASTYAYKHARQIIKKHVNADENDILVTAGTGMTGVLARLQQIMGLRWPDSIRNNVQLAENEKPVVFISHMEHHSNHVPWMETIADVVILEPDEHNMVCPHKLTQAIQKYKDRSLKIGSFTACSNVTGIITPYHKLAKIMHQYRGFCFIDFAASAPYEKIDMHPTDPEERLDAIFFSPHKFLGGPGTCGILVFNKDLYNTKSPIVPGGGNVKWTNPWGEYQYFDDIETKEDGGTPGFLQVMKTAMVIRLKEKMDETNIQKREEQLLTILFKKLKEIEGLYILGDLKTRRIGCVSFGIENIHYNLIVRLLNDRFGIQVRGGWSCASTYSHHLFKIKPQYSKEIMTGINNKDLSHKPGWVRLSIHPTTTEAELSFICYAIDKIVENINEWKNDYVYCASTNEFENLKKDDSEMVELTKKWFEV
ncbi:aminotransferase class V-fold PLP-dependent enzyme [Aureibaculum sp. 2210JD6-5]|uniref:aminotransferase class V-fold PLP-dependent enzyme n=1 Tax=Aureibaculum sp. 2210JD6-5 TaxID=3103957 RepID=UPI002AAEC439|nr:aminotransferase class V-fold PLP-dependent enzyme [Aureibaculum sp. 2210JD6-5]MDY7396764.1 aminotransferase class V-fold PLP-dependent enzyme [Aureibaculum sp. 2210JD6-5]